MPVRDIDVACTINGLRFLPICNDGTEAHDKFEKCLRELFSNADGVETVRGRRADDLPVYGKRMEAPVEVVRHILDAAGLCEIALTLREGYNGVGARTWWWVIGKTFYYDAGRTVFMQAC
jgi:hypothetical protein